MYYFYTGLDLVTYILMFAGHLLKSHQLHLSQTLHSPVQTILQPKPQPIIQQEHQQSKTVEGVGQQQHQQPPVALLQNFVTPNTTPQLRSKKESMTVKFEAPGTGKQENEFY